MSVSNDLQTELQSRVNKYGDEVRDRFVRVCLKSVDPCLISFSHYFADLTGEKFNKPKYADGTVNPLWPTDTEGASLDIPRDETERREFFSNLRVTTMDSWLNRLKDGEFDNAPADTKVEEAPKEEPVAGGVEITKEKVSKVDKVMDQVVKELPDKVELESTDTAHPVIRLREAIEDIARGCVGPGTDSNAEERMDRLEAKLDAVIETQRKHATALKTIAEKLKDSLSKVPGIIKDEIMKRFS
jgi:hypothetical protein